MDLKVNDAEWAALSKDEQARIEEIIGSFFKGSRIAPDKATKATAQASAAAPTSLCEAACNVIQAAATAACVGIGNPIAIAACVAVATEAGKACRDAC